MKNSILPCLVDAVPAMSTTIDPGIVEALRASRKFQAWKPRIVYRKPVDPTSPILEKHFSPSELAEVWGVDVETIRNLFRNEPGVMKIGDKNPKHKRPYLTLRIPESVAVRLHRRLAE
jgi:hypothetical protein